MKTNSMAAVSAAFAALAIAAVVAAGSPSYADGVYIPRGAREVPAMAVPNRQIDFDISLPISHKSQLDQLVSDVYDPKSPSFGHYLTPAQFAVQYGANQNDYDAVIAELAARGFKVTANCPTRTYLHASGTAAQVESMFQVHMKEYMDTDSQYFHAPDIAPSVPQSLALHGAAIMGLNTGMKQQCLAGNPQVKKKTRLHLGSTLPIPMVSLEPDRHRSTTACSTANSPA